MIFACEKGHEPGRIRGVFAPAGRTREEHGLHLVLEEPDRWGPPVSGKKKKKKRGLREKKEWAGSARSAVRARESLVGCGPLAHPPFFFDLFFYSFSENYFLNNF